MKKKKKKHCFVSRFSFAFQGFGLWIKEYKKKKQVKYSRHDNGALNLSDGEHIKPGKGIDPRPTT